MEELHDWQKVFNMAKQFVLDGGKIIRESFKKDLTIDFKGNRSDLVTNIDKQTEKFLITKIKEVFPSHRILGEEGHGDNVQSLEGTVWIIDPLDGTMNFVHMQRHFAISVGIYHNGEGKIGIIYDVVNDDFYYAIKGNGAFLNNEPLDKLQPVDIGDAVFGLNAYLGIENKFVDHTIFPPLIKAVRGTRSFGSATIEMAYVASGKLDGYISLRLSPWDFAAGKVIIEEVGGKVTSIDGKPLELLKRQIPVFVAKPGLHENVLNNYLKK